MRAVAGRLRLDMARFRELAAFAQFGSELDPATQAQLTRGQRLQELLKQPQSSPMPVEDQIVSIFAGISGRWTGCPWRTSARYERELLQFIRQRHAELLRAHPERAPGVHQPPQRGPGQGASTPAIDEFERAVWGTGTAEATAQTGGRTRRTATTEMATQREIRRRMGSIRNIRQITRAMELIAVTRLRRAQQRVLASRPYADKMRQVLGDLVERIVPPETEAQIGARAEREARDWSTATRRPRRPIPCWNGAPCSRLGVLLLTTDRGLCGALNSNILRTALQYVYARQNEGQAVELIVVGRKGLQAIGACPST